MKASDFNAYNSVWDSPKITSFWNLFPENYDKEVFEFWASRLTGAMNHVVDLGCGNGALAWIANDLLNADNGRTQITGVDAAQIDPFRVLERNEADYPMIRFLGNTPIENLPFADASVDHVISQYGLEYAKLGRAVPEISRVLTDAGRVSLILHDDKSHVVKVCRDQLDAMRLVMSEIPLHEDLLALLDLSGSSDDAVATTQSSYFRSLTERINKKVPAVQAIASSLGEISCVRWYLETLHHAIKEISDAPAARKRAQVERARDGMIEHMARLEALDLSALNVHRRHYLLGLLEDEGFEVTENRGMKYDGDLDVGVVIAAERQARPR